MMELIEKRGGDKLLTHVDSFSEVINQGHYRSHTTPRTATASNEEAAEAIISVSLASHFKGTTASFMPTASVSARETSAQETQQEIKATNEELSQRT